MMSTTAGNGVCATAGGGTPMLKSRVASLRALPSADE